jgi:hypothetical protein
MGSPRRLCGKNAAGDQSLPRGHPQVAYTSRCLTATDVTAVTETHQARMTQLPDAARLTNIHLLAYGDLT